MSESPRNENFGVRLRALASGHGSAKSVAVYTMVFTLILTAVFAAAVGGVNELLRAKKESQAKVAKQRVILSLFGLAGRDEEDAATLERLYRENVEAVEGEGGKGVAWYGLKKPGSTLFVIPLSGRGFWAPIHGYLALDEKTGKVTGVRFTAHEETPGLGGRIGEDWFTDQFKDMPLLTNPAGARLRLVRGGASDRKTEADAITGATGTSSAVETLMNQCLDKFALARKGAEK